MYHKPYTIQKTVKGLMFIMPKDYRGINYILPFVSDELRAKSYAGYIVLDLLLSNGNNTNRYFELYFDGKQVIRETIQKLFPPPSEYQSLSNQFIKKHPEILDHGVLTKFDIEEIKGIIS